MSKRKYRLRNLKITRVDQVDAGANQDAHIMITKADDTKPAADSAARPSGDRSQSPGGPGGGEGEVQNPGRPSRLVRFTPEDFVPSDMGDSYKEWEIPKDKLPEGIEEITITQFTDGQEVRWQWFIDPVSGPPTEGNAKSAADAIMALRSAATTTGAEASQPGMLPDHEKGTPGKDQPQEKSEGGESPSGNPPSRLQELMASLTKGLIDADVFKSTTTGEDLRDILPAETLEDLSNILSARASAKSKQEADMDLEALGDSVSQEVLDYIDQLEKRVEKAESSSTTDDDPIAKALEGLPDKAVAIIKAQQHEIERAQAQIEEERLAKRNEAWVAKARALDGVVDSPDEFGTQLREIADISEDLANSVVTALAGAAARVEKGDLFSEKGHSKFGDENVTTRVERLAKGLQEADASLNEDDAILKALATDPELYSEYTRAHLNKARS